MAMNTPGKMARNPGPNWGFAFLSWAERRLPRWIFRPALMAGTWVGLAFMPGPRAHSREYLAVVLGRPPRLGEMWGHFFAFIEFIIRMLRAARGAPVRCELAPENAAVFETLLNSGQSALFGTFHFGCSDLLGYMLGERGRRVSIVRMRVSNSEDTRLLGERFGDRVSFLWMNDPAQMLFALKAAIEAGESVALKCDRPQFCAKAEPFQFLGAPRLFPFTIYHLAVLFDRPVAFCTAIPGGADDEMRVYASTVFTPDPAAGREPNLREARRHFQAVLVQLETLVRQHPFLWFNFLPLNPVAPTTAP